jgi:hypothetical protein
VLTTSTAVEDCPGVFWASVNGVPIYYLFNVTISSGFKSLNISYSSSPLGPFTAVSNPFGGSFQGGYEGPEGSPTYTDEYIDPTVFQDPLSHNVYMFFKHKKVVGGQTGSTWNIWLMGVQLDPTPVSGVPYVNTLGSTVQMLTLYETSGNTSSNYQPWESGTIEHPVMFYAPNAPSTEQYVLMYNGGDWQGGDYAVGYAYGATPLQSGGFTRPTAWTTTFTSGAWVGTPVQGENPMLYAGQSGTVISGPGSPNPIVDSVGNPWLLYRYESPAGTSTRVTSIDRFHAVTSGSNVSVYMTPSVGTTFTASPWPF